ncbi:CO(2)-response secreted protease-like [Phalaenopsis equestris]|uniref:CO(2)-response secreted protease-like n=1 Tax=Phalaenopsis equestris TaxID=78828 RepID=UPI0009E58258|nr:CO(2)-response secreted protease-like [Phalaenopsis equestris]
MSCLPSLLCLLLLLLLLVGVNGKKEDKRQVYVVYMGAVPSHTAENTLKNNHIQLLSSVLPRGQPVEKSLIRRYKNSFSGFAARLSENEANALRNKAGVISIFTDPIYQLHTTRSWDFLQETSVETVSNPATDVGSSPTSDGSDTIIGLLDTGIWPESESFRDDGMGPIPSRWKGACMGGNDFNSSNCNRKLIGARHYDLEEEDEDSLTIFPKDASSPRDDHGHGTHTSSTAAGSPVMEASFYGLAEGTAKGGSVSSRIAMYKVCGSEGCPGSAMLSAFDDAIADGVDLLSISIGASEFFRPDFTEDPIAIGAFHAVERGITVVCSAGNDGPGGGSVVNAAPWILTVGATTIDRFFESDVVLGGSHAVAVKGSAINFSNLNKSATYPLIYAASASSNSSSNDAEASHCNLDSLNERKIKRKIVLCEHSDDDNSKIMKAEDLKTKGAVGAIFIDDVGRSVASMYIDFPATEVTTEGSEQILKYINSTKNPTATILPTITVTKYKPAPEVAYFSSRGPSSQTSNIIKPDISAPGVNILASWTRNEDFDVAPPGRKPSHFNLVCGTSMACPHVAGIAATIKSWNPTWSPAAIRSAIMTTAMQSNNDKAPVTTDSGSVATPYDYGAGVINPTRVLQPGLVYEIETKDYLQFLCNYGYTTKTIKNMTVIPNGFECSKNSSKDLISNLNYPSIAISGFTGKERKVSREVKNVGGVEDTTYVVSIKSPSQLSVEVLPDKLQFSKSVTKLSYQVSFTASSSRLKGDYFGSITWSDGTHRVRSPFVVKSS